MKNQKELNLEEMEKVSGGEAVELAGGFKPFISVQTFENKPIYAKPVENFSDPSDNQINQNDKSNRQVNPEGTNTFTID